MRASIWPMPARPIAATAQAAPAHSRTATSSSTATGWDPVPYPTRWACQAAGEKTGQQWQCVRRTDGTWRLYIYS
ncbi:hypothetical protein BG653_01207 [Streptomyces platensis]|uniref:Secreted protein n=1 Tax=Streptomyces platensis TaxID=58346 RepID=A0ABX3Y4E1_STRPT|nr:hypothetical protein BG653_01207 [Streptomyces platensis]